MRLDSAKYYVVAECDTEGRRQAVMDRQLEIDRIISSLRMGQDIGGYVEHCHETHIHLVRRAFGDLAAGSGPREFADHGEGDQAARVGF